MRKYLKKATIWEIITDKAVHLDEGWFSLIEDK